MEDTLTKLAGIFTLALIVQVLVQNLKPITGDKYSAWWSAIVGIAVAIATQAGMLQLLGWPVRWPVLDQVLTGLALSGGAGVLYELLRSRGMVKAPGTPAGERELKRMSSD